jgi:hypothetical protein
MICMSGRKWLPHCISPAEPNRPFPPAAAQIEVQSGPSEFSPAGQLKRFRDTPSKAGIPGRHLPRSVSEPLTL